MTAKEKLSSLREVMKREQINAFIIYAADPHLSEYLPKEWQERKWLSGFTGSAGFVVVTQDKAGLWTDGRYFTQAPIELAGSGIDLFKEGVAGTPHYIDWIIDETSNNARVGVNALACSRANWKELEEKLTAKNKNLVDTALLDEVWSPRPAASTNPVFVQDIKYAGQSVEDKLKNIREALASKNATAHIISSLDDVAWTLNLRGSDVACNPVFLGYIYLDATSCKLFVDTNKLNEEANAAMKAANVEVLAYDSFFDFLSKVENENILIAPNSNQSIFHHLEDKNKIIEAAVPGNLMKAIKNEVELEGFRTVMVRDGVAMVKFLHWLTHEAAQQELNEYEIGKRLTAFRAEGKNYVGDSFGSIVGYQGNGAIIHYSAPKEGSANIAAKGSILVDSGGQYIEGTTDITRTLALGEVSKEFKIDSTRALQGMIRLSMIKFPKGTLGMHLDVLARQALWEVGKDYNHGTGHGVGSFMNVHEGPQSIRKDLNPTVLQAGMVLSNEPGYYVEGQYGIRHENLIAVREWKTTEWNTFYEFETLTFCPFFTDTIVKDLLSSEEVAWLNAYHKTCEEKLAPYLEGEVKDWFLELVKPI